jgi:flagellar biosynthesis protein FlhA
LDTLERSTPKLVEDLVPKMLTLGQVLKVLQNLLAEKVPIRDIRTIAETLAEHAVHTQDPNTLTAAVRVALSRSIIQQLAGPKEEISVVVLDPGLEQILQQTLRATDEGGAGFEPGLIERMQQALVETAGQQEAAGMEAILLVAATIRPWLARFAKQSVPSMKVLSYNEIPDDRQIKVVATIGKGAEGV